MVGGGLESGVVVGDRYRLRRLLGEGGMGWVWEATELATDRPVALKLLKSANDTDRKRFNREVRAAAAIRHPNVITVHELVELPDGMLVIVMDLLDGETLASLLRRKRRISLREVAAIFVPVLAALEAAHALGIIHRDVKPDNIYLCGTGDDLDVKVLDFGIAKLTAEDGVAARTQALTGTGSMVGTPYYMSPEQVFGDTDLDARADIWSLGIAMYECLTGLRPTEADTVGRVLKRIMAAEFEPITTYCADLPGDVTSVVARMLSADREDRPRDLAEIRKVLLRYGGATARHSGVPRSTPESSPESSPEPARERTPAPPPPMPTEDDGAGRADTNRGVSVRPTRASRTRTRLVAAGAIAALASIGSAVYLRGRYEERTTSRAPSTALPALPSAAPAASATSPRPPDPEPPPPASAAPGANPTPTAPAAAPAPALAKLPPSVVSKPSCEKGEVLSEGHCCLRGHRWREGRCERPLATSF